VLSTHVQNVSGKVRSKTVAAWQWRVYVIRDAKGYYHNDYCADLAKTLDNRTLSTQPQRFNGDTAKPPYLFLWSALMPCERACIELCHWLSYGIPTRDFYFMFHKDKDKGVHRKFVYMRMLRTKVAKIREKYAPASQKPNAYGVRNPGALKPKGRRGKHLRELLRVRASGDPGKDAS
jgi:hypothetical protein